LHLFKELPGISAERLDIFSPPFCINGIEGQRAFALAAYAGNNHQFNARNAQADVLKIVFRRTCNPNRLIRSLRHVTFPLV